MGVILLLSRGNEEKQVLIDSKDWEHLSKYRWNLSGKDKKTYVTTRINGDSVLMHNLVMSDKNIDHKNGNSLDNRKKNLRKATQLQNSYNRGTNKNNTTGYNGVSKQHNKYTAQIHNKGLKIHLGVFNTAKEAAKAYDIYAKKLHGIYANLNFRKNKKPDFFKYTIVKQDDHVAETGYIGVYIDRKMVNSDNIYFSKIMVDKKTKYLGYFKCPKEAAIAYNEAVKKFNLKRKINNINE